MDNLRRQQIKVKASAKTCLAAVLSKSKHQNQLIKLVQF
jgi:hypothetical protein